MENVFKLEVEIESAKLFADDFTDIAYEVEILLAKLEQHSNRQSIFKEITEKIAYLETKANACSLFPIAESLEIIVNIFNCIDPDSNIISVKFTDVLYILLDKLSQMIESAKNTQAITFEQFTTFQHIGRLMTSITPQNYDAIYNQTYQHISDHADVIINQQEISGNDDVDLFSESKETPLIEEKSEVVIDLDSKITIKNKLEEDLGFFRKIAETIDETYYGHKRRSFFISALAVGLNEQGGAPVPVEQLKAAVLLHDFGMVLFNENFLKKDKLSVAEIALLKQHPIYSCELLNESKYWDLAAQIILQHHEREDGKGYPQGLSGNQIYDGAKIIAIIDAFFSMTHPVTKRKHKRSYLRAIAEINACGNSQFSGKWVEYFNKLVRNEAYN